MRILVRNGIAFALSLFSLAVSGEVTVKDAWVRGTVAAQTTTGAFMIRHGRYKYVHYVAYAPQLFDLEADSEELRDLAPDPAYAKVLEECRSRLYAICNPEAVDARAKQRQAELLEAAGGREAVIKRGDLGFSPPPGYPAVFG